MTVPDQHRVDLGSQVGILRRRSEVRCRIGHLDRSRGAGVLGRHGCGWHLVLLVSDLAGSEASVKGLGDERVVTARLRVRRRMYKVFRRGFVCRPSMIVRLPL